MLFLSLLHEVLLVLGGTLVTFTPDIFKRISGWPENFSTIFSTRGERHFDSSVPSPRAR